MADFDEPLPPLPAVYFAKPWRLVLALLGSVGFVAVGVFLYQQEPSAKLAGIACILFFGLGLFIIPYRLLRPAPLFALHQQGLMLRPDMPLVPWTAVSEVQLVKIKHNTFVALMLFDPEVYYQRLKPSTQAMVRLSAKIAGTPLVVHASLAGIKPATLAGWIEQLCLTASRR